MKCLKNLIFIPYQDMYNFMNEGILTREYAIYSYLCDAGFERQLFLNKPRTRLSRRKISAVEFSFPVNSLERRVRDSIRAGEVIFPEKAFDPGEIIFKRSWWPGAYMPAMDKIRSLGWNWNETLVYSNNPYAYRLLAELKSMGVKIIFDAMDNLCTFPNLRVNEQETAFRGYGEMARISDFFSCNSARTQAFMADYFGRSPVLIKNGVFRVSGACRSMGDGIEQVRLIREKRKGYKTVLGYIGKFGPKMDVELIKELCARMPDVLYVLVGFDVTRGGSFSKQVSGIDNLMCLPGVPSAYIYSVMEEFDILTIPYMAGKNENSGDPLKLYQYMMTDKPIIAAPIREIDEYAEHIHICSGAQAWVECVRSCAGGKRCYDAVAQAFMWDHRLKPMIDFYSSAACGREEVEK